MDIEDIFKYYNYPSGFIISSSPLKWQKMNMWEQTKKKYLPNEKYQVVIQNIG